MQPALCFCKLSFVSTRSFCLWIAWGCFCSLKVGWSCQQSLNCLLSGAVRRKFADRWFRPGTFTGSFWALLLRFLAVLFSLLPCPSCKQGRKGRKWEGAGRGLLVSNLELWPWTRWTQGLRRKQRAALGASARSGSSVWGTMQLLSSSFLGPLPQGCPELPSTQALVASAMTQKRSRLQPEESCQQVWRFTLTVRSMRFLHPQCSGVGCWGELALRKNRDNQGILDTRLMIIARCKCDTGIVLHFKRRVAVFLTDF